MLALTRQYVAGVPVSLPAVARELSACASALLADTPLTAAAAQCVPEQQLLVEVLVDCLHTAGDTFLLTVDNAAPATTPTPTTPTAPPTSVTRAELHAVVAACLRSIRNSLGVSRRCRERLHSNPSLMQPLFHWVAICLDTTTTTAPATAFTEIFRLALQCVANAVSGNSPLCARVWQHWTDCSDQLQRCLSHSDAKVCHISAMIVYSVWLDGDVLACVCRSASAAVAADVVDQLCRIVVEDDSDFARLALERIGVYHWVSVLAMCCGPQYGTTRHVLYTVIGDYCQQQLDRHPTTFTTTTTASVITSTTKTDSTTSSSTTDPAITSFTTDSTTSSSTTDPTITSFTTDPTNSSSTNDPAITSFTTDPTNTSSTNDPAISSFTTDSTTTSSTTDPSNTSCTNDPAISSTTTDPTNTSSTTDSTITSFTTDSTTSSSTNDPTNTSSTNDPTNTPKTSAITNTSSSTASTTTSSSSFTDSTTTSSSSIATDPISNSSTSTTATFTSSANFGSSSRLPRQLIIGVVQHFQRQTRSFLAALDSSSVDNVVKSPTGLMRSAVVCEDASVGDSNSTAGLSSCKTNVINNTVENITSQNIESIPSAQEDFDQETKRKGHSIEERDCGRKVEDRGSCEVMGSASGCDSVKNKGMTDGEEYDHADICSADLAIPLPECMLPPPTAVLARHLEELGRLLELLELITGDGVADWPVAQRHALVSACVALLSALVALADQPGHQLSAVRHPLPAAAERQLQQLPSFGLTGRVVRVLAAGVWQCRQLQLVVGRSGAVALVLACCRLDQRQPFLQQAAVWAVRALCQHCHPNQQLVRQLQLDSLCVDTRHQLQQLGLTAATSDGRLTVSSAASTSCN